MIILGAAVIGSILGVNTARRRNGNRLDMLQYGFGFGICFGLFGGVVTILIERLVT